ncbi:MAG: hypothetical protein JWR88_2583, partial [Pseudonocardia sp.]|nr:hypothetical protein [Pseudonocardia sp.]
GLAPLRWLALSADLGTVRMKQIPASAALTTLPRTVGRALGDRRPKRIDPSGLGDSRYPARIDQPAIHQSDRPP